MRTGNPYESPRGEDTPEQLQDRLFNLKRDLLQKVHDRWDILALLEQGKTNEYIQEVKQVMPLVLAVVIVGVIELWTKQKGAGASKSAILKNKKMLLEQINLEDAIRPVWLMLANDLIVRNNLSIKLNLNEEKEKYLKEAWSLVMGSI